MEMTPFFNCLIGTRFYDFQFTHTRICFTRIRSRFQLLQNPIPHA
jgi:hypothetical protein